MFRWVIAAFERSQGRHLSGDDPGRRVRASGVGCPCSATKPPPDDSASAPRCTHGRGSSHAILATCAAGEQCE